MSIPLLNNVARFVLLVLLQVLVFNYTQFGMAGIQVGLILAYPLFLLFLPISSHRAWIVLLAFILGIVVDLFSNTLGLHASASLVTGFLRKNVLDMIQPRGGYKVNQIPSIHYFGLPWFLRFLAIMLLIHTLSFYVVKVFDLSQIGIILIKTFVSYILSFVVLSLIGIIVNPRI